MEKREGYHINPIYVNILMANMLFCNCMNAVQGVTG